MQCVQWKCLISIGFALFCGCEHVSANPRAVLLVSAQSVCLCVFVRALCGGRLYNINVLLMGDGVRPRSGGPSPRTRRRLNYLSCSQGVDSMEGVGGIQRILHTPNIEKQREEERKKKEKTKEEWTLGCTPNENGM